MSTEQAAELPPLPQPVVQNYPSGKWSYTASQMRAYAEQHAAAELEKAREDARRYRWLSDRFLGADFEWGEPARPVLLIDLSPGGIVYGDLSLTIDETCAGLSTDQAERKV